MIESTPTSVLIAMSGGVDSAVTAFLMNRLGYRCEAATMLLRPANPTQGTSCGSMSDVEDAKQVAEQLEIRHHVFDFTDCFADEVIRRFVQAYESGRTPNPCIDCNRYLKFEKLFEPAKQLGCSYIATGHYARIGYDTEQKRYLLKKATDTEKDQSYVLWSLRQDRLRHVRFPLGDLKKTDVRKIAEINGLCNAQKRDSQDICFVPNGKYAEFLKEYTQKDYPAGDFVGPEGQLLGRHRGIIHYTVGQKKGLELVLPEPLFVKSIHREDNTVHLCRSEELFSNRLTAKNINLISVERIAGEMRVKAKIRYRQAEEWATVTQTDTDRIEVIFDRPQRAITPGQSVVLYDGDIVVGGGIIE